MVTVLTDFTHIAGADGSVRRAAGNESAISNNFNTGGILGDRSALLMFSVDPDETVAQADVYINEHKVGDILVAVQNGYTVQTVAIERADLAEFRNTDGRDNVFAIKNVPRSFRIKDVVCFFHQES